MLRLLKIAVVSVVTIFLTAHASQATSILVGQCIEFDTCWTSLTSTPWGDTLSAAELASLGLGTDQPLIAVQTSKFVVRLGETTITFSTPGGPVIETLPEFSGGFHNDPCNLCEIATVGTFFIPNDATSAIISGTFGNSIVANSAGYVCSWARIPIPVPALSPLSRSPPLLPFSAAVFLDWL
jgi:hypothetical protein